MKKTAFLQVRIEEEVKAALIEAFGVGELSDLSRQLLKKELKKYERSKKLQDIR